MLRKHTPQIPFRAFEHGWSLYPPLPSSQSCRNKREWVLLTIDLGSFEKSTTVVHQNKLSTKTKFTGENHAKGSVHTPSSPYIARSYFAICLRFSHHSSVEWIILDALSVTWNQLLLMDLNYCCHRCNNIRCEINTIKHPTARNAFSGSEGLVTFESDFEVKFFLVRFIQRTPFLASLPLSFSFTI